MAVVALVALRLAIGWHFYREGADKIIEGNFSTAGFFRTAKGPLAPLYKLFLWDGEGKARLNQEATLDAWTQYRQQVVEHYGFDEKQQKQADQIYRFHADQLTSFFEEKQEDLKKYFKGLERRDRNHQDPARQGVTSLRNQAEQIDKDVHKDLGPWLSEIDAMWKGYELDLNELATEAQAGRRWFALPKPGRHFLDTLFIDPIIPYFDLLVGACLILGLGTRLASLAGAGFLASIVGTQFPGAAGAIPTYYQVIEMFAMLVLAAFGAGCFAGLDSFLEPWCLRFWKRFRAPQTEPKTENKA